MYCPNCGEEILSHEKFCLKCGFELSKLDNRISQIDPQNSPSSDKLWICSSCNKEFIPTGGKYNCPNCHSSATSPVEVKESVLNQIKESKRMNYGICPFCGEILVGYPDEKDISILYVPDFKKTIFRCSKCNRILSIS